MILLPERSPKIGLCSTDLSLPTQATIEIQNRILTDPAGTVTAARTNLLDFTRFTKRDFMTNWHHAHTAAHLDRLQRGEIKRLIITMPPRHGKSELSTRRLAAYALGCNPDEQVMGCSYAKDLAGRMNRDSQRIIDSQAYRDLFPGTRLSGRSVAKASFGNWVRTSDLFEVVGHKGSYRSAGVGGGIAGMGFTLGIVDDPVKNREEADSPTIRQKVWDWWANDFFPRRWLKPARCLTSIRMRLSPSREGAIFWCP